MGSSGSSKTGLTPPKNPNQQVATVMGGKPVTFGGTIQSAKGFNANKWEKALKSGKPVTSDDAIDKNVSIPSISMSQSSPEQYKDYGFSPQMSMGYGDPAQMMYKDMSYISQQAEEEDSLAQFLRWQREKGY